MKLTLTNRTPVLGLLLIFLGFQSAYANCSGIEGANASAQKLVHKIESIKKVVAENYASMNQDALDMGTGLPAEMGAPQGARLSRTQALATFDLLETKDSNRIESSEIHIFENEALFFEKINIPLEKSGAPTGAYAEFVQNQTNLKWEASLIPVQDKGQSFFEKWEAVLSADMKSNHCDRDHYFNLTMNHGVLNFVGRVENDGSIIAIPWYDYANYGFITGREFKVDSYFLNKIGINNPANPDAPGGGASVGN